MRFTKKKRNQVYRKALEVYIDKDVITYGVPCLCYTLAEAADILDPDGTGWGCEVDDLTVRLKEFFAKKPEDKQIGETWWPTDSLEWADFRVKILEQLIEETK